MEINSEQIKRTIIKETLGECIREIEKEIESDKLKAFTVSQFYINGLVRAINIIKEIKRERYL